MKRSASQGFTMIEVAVVSGLFGILLALFGRTLATSIGLVSTSRATLLSSDDERRSLDAITGVLRGCDYLSLTGFDSTGCCSDLSFQRVLGADASGCILDTSERMCWRSTTTPADGIANPGEVVLIKNGVTSVVAPRVPKDGFVVALSGNTLRVTLTTYCSTSQRKVASCTATTYVSVRN